MASNVSQKRKGKLDKNALQDFEGRAEQYTAYHRIVTRLLLLIFLLPLLVGVVIGRTPIWFLLLTFLAGFLLLVALDWWVSIKLRCPNCNANALGVKKHCPCCGIATKKGTTMCSQCDALLAGGMRILSRPYTIRFCHSCGQLIHLKGF